jgi:hypothetical protein
MDPVAALTPSSSAPGTPSGRAQHVEDVATQRASALGTGHWALALIGTPTTRLAVLILEAGTTDTYTAIRTRLTLAGCINKISLPDWQVSNWLDSGRLQLHHAGSKVTGLSTPGPTLHIPAASTPPRSGSTRRLHPPAVHCSS